MPYQWKKILFFLLLVGYTSLTNRLCCVNLGNPSSIPLWLYNLKPLICKYSYLECNKLPMPSFLKMKAWFWTWESSIRNILFFRRTCLDNYQTYVSVFDYTSTINVMFATLHKGLQPQWFIKLTQNRNLYVRFATYRRWWSNLFFIYLIKHKTATFT